MYKTENKNKIKKAIRRQNRKKKKRPIAGREMIILDKLLI